MWKLKSPDMKSYMRRTDIYNIFCLFSLFLLVIVSETPCEAQNAIRPNKSIRLGGYFYASTFRGPNLDMSSDQITWAGANLDIISAVPTVSEKTVLELRKINPLLRFYLMSYSTTLFEQNVYNFPLFNPKIMGGWVVRYKNGQEAIGVRRTSADSKAHIMDISLPEYADFFRTSYAKLVKERSADGIASDEIVWQGYGGIGWGVKNPDLLAKNPSLGESYETAYKWLERISTPQEFEIITQAFWDEAQKYTNGIWGELAFYAAEDAQNKQRWIYYKTMNWEELIRNMEQISRQGKTYIWAAWYDRDDKTQLEYSLATYLIGKRSDSVVFQPQPLFDGSTAPNPKNLAGYNIDTVRMEYEKKKKLFNVELGEPLETATKMEKEGRYYWRRKFAKGLTLCNPSSVLTISIPLDQIMFDVDGKQIQTVTLKPKSGIILLKSK